MTPRPDDAVPADPLDWRPQVPFAGRRMPPVTDPIVEPLWSGRRVLAHVAVDHPPSVRLIDDRGDVVAADAEMVARLAQAVLAFDAVIDGILSAQATRGGEGVSIVHQARVGRGSVFLPRDANIDVERRDELLAEPLVAFVALDLLRLDGRSLLDVPLLERKRVLDAVVQPSERIRVSPYTRPPIDAWVASWKGAGFKGALLKAANGRYVPGGMATDWVAVTRIGGRDRR